MTKDAVIYYTSHLGMLQEKLKYYAMILIKYGQTRLREVEGEEAKCSFPVFLCAVYEHETIRHRQQSHRTLNVKLHLIRGQSNMYRWTGSWMDLTAYTYS